MTEVYSPNPDDVLSESLQDETPSARLDRQADRLLDDAEGHASARSEGIRKAVRSDLNEGKQWAADRAEKTRDAIRDEPMKTALYAVGLGVLIGLLLRR